MTNEYHRFTDEELEEMQKTFDNACSKNPDFAKMDPRRIELARTIVISHQPGLPEDYIAMLAMSMVV